MGQLEALQTKSFETHFRANGFLGKLACLKGQSLEQISCWTNGIGYQKKEKNCLRIWLPKKEEQRLYTGLVT